MAVSGVGNVRLNLGGRGWVELLSVTATLRNQGLLWVHVCGRGRIVLSSDRVMFPGSKRYSWLGSRGEVCEVKEEVDLLSLLSLRLSHGSIFYSFTSKN